MTLVSAFCGTVVREIEKKKRKKNVIKPLLNDVIFFCFQKIVKRFTLIIRATRGLWRITGHIQI